MFEHADKLSDRDLNRLRGLIYEQCGISLGPEKRVMLEGRLRRRIVHLGLNGYAEYCKLIFAPTGAESDEIHHLIDVVTTNKTDFFREEAHFDLLQTRVLPCLWDLSGGTRDLLIWSAGCSTGEEPYTLAIVLTEYCRSHPGFRFRILATDISGAVLEKAERAIFSAEAVRPIPPHLRQRYFMRSRDPKSNLLRVVPELRELVEFRRLNLMDDFGMSELADAIFCRNVAIYFDQDTQERLFRKLTRQLVDGGYLFIGHSESLHRMDVGLEAVAPTLYRKAQ